MIFVKRYIGLIIKLYRSQFKFMNLCKTCVINRLSNMFRKLFSYKVRLFKFLNNANCTSYNNYKIKANLTSTLVYWKHICSAIQRRGKINRLKYNLAPDNKTEQESYICSLIGFCDKV